MKKPYKKSFAKRLSLNIVGLTSILFILAIWVAALFSHLLIAKEASQRAADVESAAAAEINNVLQRVETAAENAVWLVNENRNDEEFLYHITEQMVSQNQDIIGCAVAFAPDYCGGRPYFSPYSWADPADGILQSKQLGSDEYDYFNMEWFSVPFASHQPVWSEPYYDEGGGDMQMATYSVPLIGEDGQVVCVVTADISLQWLSDLLSSIQPYPNSYPFLLSGKGAFVGFGSDRLKGNATLLDVADNLESAKLRELSRAMTAGEDGSLRYINKKRSTFVAYGPIGNGWSLAVVCGYKEVLAGASFMHLVLILVGLIGLLALFFICRSIIFKLTRPLSDFAESALNIAKGDFNTPLPEVTSNDEIRRLRDSFDYMQTSLTSYISDLKQTTAANERMESELNIASAIQAGMLSHDFPTSSIADICADMHPAREVGGDLYDFKLKDDMLYFAIGDVSGKGVPASLLMAITRAAFSFLAGSGFGVRGVVEHINNALSEGNQTGMFVTLFAGRINLKTGEFHYCNAGHNPPLVIPSNPDEALSYLPVKPNLAVGVMPDFDFEEQETILPRGTRLVLYTDGVTEAEDASLAQFGEERLKAWAEGCRASNPTSQQCVESLFGAVNTYTGNADQNDDITVMIIKI